MGLFFNYHGNPKVGNMILVGSLALLGTCGSCQLVNSYNYSQGERVGVINKVSKKGVLWKTYEGQMALEGIVGGNSVGANLWDFSIDRWERHGIDEDSIAQKLTNFLNQQKKVKVKYIQSILLWPPRGSTKYYIQNVELLPEK